MLSLTWVTLVLQSKCSIWDSSVSDLCSCVFFFQAEDGIRDIGVTGVQTCALPIWACLHVVKNSDRRTLEGLVQATTAPGAMLNTDEWRGYGRVTELGRGHATVNHGEDRKSVGWGKRVDLGGGRII